MANILIVDDKEANLLVLEKTLGKLDDVTIFRAFSGEQALQATLNHEFALVFLDVQMPGMDGYELAGILKTDPATRDVPIIFISAIHISDPYVFQGYAAGGADYIIKPFNPKLVLSKARTFLTLFEQRKELIRQKEELQDLVGSLEEQIRLRKEAEDNLKKANETLTLKVDEKTADLARSVQALENSNEQLVFKSCQLKALTAELTMAEHRQRDRIAKILHDGLQQHLVVAKLQLSLLASGTLLEDPKTAAGKVEKMIGEAISMSRSLSMEISPPVLHKKNLLAGFRWLAGWMKSKHGLKVDLQIEDQPGLPEDVKILVFESVRELLFNAVKHAGVSSAGVDLKPTGEKGIQVRVSDKGKGFDAGKVFNSKASETGFGLLSIRERIGSIGGCLDIEASPGKGSCFTLTVPCRNWEEQVLRN